MKIRLHDKNKLEIKTFYDLPFDPFLGREMVSIKDKDDQYRIYLIVNSKVSIVMEEPLITYTLDEVTEWRDYRSNTIGSWEGCAIDGTIEGRHGR